MTKSSGNELRKGCLLSLKRTDLNIDMKKILTIVLVGVMLAGSSSSFLTATPAQAFCLFNCAAEDLKNRLQANVDCFQNQIMMGVPGRTAYGTTDLSSDGKEVRIGTQW